MRENRQGPGGVDCKLIHRPSQPQIGISALPGRPLDLRSDGSHWHGFLEVLLIQVEKQMLHSGNLEKGYPEYQPTLWHEGD